MLAVMQLAMGERWDRVMFNANRAVGAAEGAAGGVAICLVAVIVGQFIVLNIFVAMPINSFKALSASAEGANMVLDKVEVTVYHEGSSVNLSVPRGKLEQVTLRGEPAVRMILAELIDLNAGQENADGEDEEHAAGGNTEGAFGLHHGDLSPRRVSLFKLFLMPDLGREVVPRQLRDIGRHFGRNEVVAVAAAVVEGGADDVEDGLTAGGCEGVTAGAMRSIHTAKTMASVELVLTGPEPKTRWDPRAQLPSERKAAFETWEMEDAGSQMTREKLVGGRGQESGRSRRRGAMLREVGQNSAGSGKAGGAFKTVREHSVGAYCVQLWSDGCG
jgi:hypothetical protein